MKAYALRSNGRQPPGVTGQEPALPLNGLWVEYEIAGNASRSVIYAHAGEMLGGNSAFGHSGAFEKKDGVAVVQISTRRHNDDPDYKAMLALTSPSSTSPGERWAIFSCSKAVRRRCTVLFSDR